MTAKDTKSNTATTQATIRLSLSDRVSEIFFVSFSIWYIISANIAKIYICNVSGPFYL